MEDQTHGARRAVAPDPTCEWGSAALCGKPATWVCYSDHYPLPMYACDQHGPRMAVADQAHRLSWAPPLPLPALKEYVTALAWRSWLLRGGSNQLRADNAFAAFLRARDEYERRRSREVVA